MLLPLALTLAVGSAGAARSVPADAFFATDQGGVGLPGYCTAPGPSQSVPPGGLMYVALGLVGTGVIVLRTERR